MIKNNGRAAQLLTVMIMRDMTLKDAASEINITTSTANTHIGRLKKHFNCKTLPSLAIAAAKEGWFKFQPNMSK